jgi:hypothetical protein
MVTSITIGGVVPHSSAPDDAGMDATARATDEMSVVLSCRRVTLSSMIVF